MRFTILFMLIVTFCSSPSSMVFSQQDGAQEQRFEYQIELDRFREWVIEDQTSDLKTVEDPDIHKFIVIAERARARIFTPDNNELRKMAREFDQKLASLQTSDLGRWIGTQDKAVATFIKLDTEILDLNDDALNARRRRLQVSVDALRRYQPETQGRFEPSTNEAVLTILKDANWVEEYYRKLTDRLALVGNLQSRFPKDQDWSNLPTLRERKQERVARMFEQIKSAETEARERASAATADLIQDSVFEREVQKAKTQIAGEDALAEFENRLMDAEFGRRLTEIDKRIMATRLETEKIRSDMVHMRADASKARLVEYLTSDRVKALLEPFCSNGFEEAHTGAGHKRIDSLTAGPMSYSRLASYGCLPANHRGMRNLIRVANNSRNDRPGWGVDENSYAEYGETFQNMQGEKVNCFIEAQRILREHGATLIELNMLRK